ncbi:hypothetical protein NM688_g1241 [Phlebia brevispora]|uniref:Uncharacterized protein n=1 Tax=Phlebia brevispora TaxID=194682 RepID=A0ACC1TC31_9APHY|nr:hypothetical protein NM688_g1241 [Phlebia brevispora]
MSLNSETQYYHHGRFAMEGGTLPDAVTAYRTYGDPSKPCIVYPTCFGRQLPGQEYMIGPDKALDPSEYFIVSFASFSNGESSSPSNTPVPYNGPCFPVVTYEDNIRAQYAVLTKELKVKRVYCAIGFSMSAQQNLFQAYYWAAMYPDFVDKFIVLCGSARTSPHNRWYVDIIRATPFQGCSTTDLTAHLTSMLEGPKAALTSAYDFHGGHYKTPAHQAMRAFGRVYSAWAYGQTWFREHGYLEHGMYNSLDDWIRDEWEGGYLRRWDANDMLFLLNTWQMGDISKVKRFEYTDLQGDLVAVLGSIQAKALLMPSKTDLYFTPEDSELELKAMQKGVGKLVVIPSVWGHMAAADTNDQDPAKDSGSKTQRSSPPRTASQFSDRGRMSSASPTSSTTAEFMPGPEVSLCLDVITEIMENLRGDLPSLKACSLLSSLWLVASRPLIFHTLYLSTETTEENIIASTFYDRLRELTESFPHICGRIQHLILRRDQKNERHFANNVQHGLTSPFMELAAVVQALRKLPSLHTLSLVGISCSMDGSSPSAVCAAVRTVILENVYYFGDDFDYIPRLLLHFPNLAELEIRRCHGKYWRPGMASNASVSNTKLRSLTVTGSWPLFFWTNFRESSLETLDLSLSWLVLSGAADLAGALRRLLRGANQSLLNLRLDLYVERKDLEEADRAIVSCSSLEALTFRVSMDRTGMPSWEYLIKLFSQKTSPQLRQVVIAIAGPDEYTLGELTPPWAEFQDACMALPSLESIGFLGLQLPAGNAERSVPSSMWQKKVYLLRMRDVSRLPLDIIDGITFHLRDDPDALKACSLVCTTWTIAARRHIFETTTLRLDDPKQPEKDPPYRAKLRQFHRFLEHTPYIRGAIKQLDIYSVSCSEDSSPDPSDYQVKIGLLFKVVQKLTALHTLVLQNVLWSRLSEREAAAHLACPSITRLIVQDADTPSCDFSQIGSIFRLLPNLKDLTLEGWEMDSLHGLDLEQPAIIELPADLRLKSLTIDDALPACFLTSLARTGSVTSLTSVMLTARRVMFRDLERLGTFFKAVGSTLKHLEICVSHSLFEEHADEEVHVRGAFSKLQLSSCTALRMLVLVPDFNVEHRYEVDLTLWLPTQVMLSTIPTANLHKVTFVIPPDCLGNFDEDDRFVFEEEPSWTELHEALLRFSRVKTVCFTSDDHDEAISADTQSYIARHLPSLRDRGLLRFDKVSNGVSRRNNHATKKL